MSCILGGSFAKPQLFVFVILTLILNYLHHWPPSMATQDGICKRAGFQWVGAGGL